MLFQQTLSTQNTGLQLFSSILQVCHECFEMLRGVHIVVGAVKLHIIHNVLPELISATTLAVVNAGSK